MVIGVLGGSFCPPTNAHLELSRECINRGLCDKVVWVPVNDAYRKSTNISSVHRVNMVKIALKDEINITYSLHEINIDTVVYTIDTLKMLKQQYPDDKILFIAGADKMGFKWFQREEMVRDFGYIVTSRDDIDCNEMINKSINLSKYRDNIKIINYKSDISSTMVREQLEKNGHSELIHPDVMKYIEATNCFKKGN